MIKGWFILWRKFPVPFAAITLFPFVFYRGKMPDWLRNHERIHLQQQLELLIFPFYIWYVLEFLVRLLKLRNPKLAYRAISFEQEAYSNHHQSDYLEKRKFWAFLKYLPKKGG